jgi:taurine dioxygenase
MAPEFRPLHDALGAEVRGLDLREEQPAEIIAAIARAWERYAVLVFHGQQLSVEDQLRFTRAFGTIQGKRGDGERAGQQYMIVGTRPVDGVPGEIGEGELMFHQDGCYTETPSDKSFLFALELPAIGGNTRFASTAHAYATLAPELRERLLDYDIRFTFDPTHYTRTPDWNPVLEYTHPLVIAHRTSGEPLLFCSRFNGEEILGLPATESRALIDQLCDALEREENVYEHVWTVGDFVLWDNLATVHARTPFDPADNRSMRRTATTGGKPVAYRANRLSAR